MLKLFGRFGRRAKAAAAAARRAAEEARIFQSRGPTIDHPDLLPKYCGATYEHNVLCEVGNVTDLKPMLRADSVIVHNFADVNVVATARILQEMFSQHNHSAVPTLPSIDVEEKKIGTPGDAGAKLTKNYPKFMIFNEFSSKIVLIDFVLGRSRFQC